MDVFYFKYNSVLARFSPPSKIYGSQGDFARRELGISARFWPPRFTKLSEMLAAEIQGSRQDFGRRDLGISAGFWKTEILGILARFWAGFWPTEIRDLAKIQKSRGQNPAENLPEILVKILYGLSEQSL